MPTTISGTSGVNKVQDGTITPGDLITSQTGNAPLIYARGIGNFMGATGATNHAINMTCTRLGTGSYQLTFTTPMPTSDYIVSVGYGPGNIGNNWNWLETTTVTKTTSTFSIGIATGGTSFDPSKFSVIVFA